jgi:hypothetical protein
MVGGWREAFVLFNGSNQNFVLPLKTEPRTATSLIESHGIAYNFSLRGANAERLKEF